MFFKLDVVFLLDFQLDWLVFLRLIYKGQRRMRFLPQLSIRYWTWFLNHLFFLESSPIVEYSQNPFQIARFKSWKMGISADGFPCCVTRYILFSQLALSKTYLICTILNIISINLYPGSFSVSLCLKHECWQEPANLVRLIAQGPPRLNN